VPGQVLGSLGAVAGHGLRELGETADVREHDHGGETATGGGWVGTGRLVRTKLVASVGRACQRDGERATTHTMLRGGTSVATSSRKRSWTMIEGR
jgi:hypothetical protein